MSSQSFCIFGEFSLDFFSVLTSHFLVLLSPRSQTSQCFWSWQCYDQSFQGKVSAASKQGTQVSSIGSREKDFFFTSFTMLFYQQSHHKKSNYGKLSYNKRQLTCDRILLFRTFFPFCNFSKEVQKISDYFFQSGKYEQYSQAQLGEINYEQDFIYNESFLLPGHFLSNLTLQPNHVGTPRE